MEPIYTNLALICCKPRRIWSLLSFAPALRFSFLKPSARNSSVSKRKGKLINKRKSTKTEGKTSQGLTNGYNFLFKSFKVAE